MLFLDLNKHLAPAGLVRFRDVHYRNRYSDCFRVLNLVDLDNLQGLILAKV